MEYTAGQLAKVLKGTVEGDPQATVTGFAKIEHGKPGKLCFFANPKYEQYVYTCKATILLVDKDFQPKEPVTHSILPPSSTLARLVFRLYIFLDQFSMVL